MEGIFDIFAAMTRHALVALAAALPLVLGACRGSDGGPTRRTLVDSRDTEDPRSLDPALSTDVPTGRAVSYLFDGLYRYTPDARLEPALAERVDLSADGRVYTAHLRRGVRFHDGRPLLARHVVASFHRVLDPRTRGGRAEPLMPIRGAAEFADGKAPRIEGLAAPNDSTVIITLGEPMAVFPKLLAMPVASVAPDSVPADFGQRPVGTGPWKLVEWKHDDYLLFARNDEYWGGPPKAESLMARIIREPSTAVAEFEVGNVDLLLVPENETRQWEQTDDKKALLHSAPGLRLVYVGINVTRGPLRDARVRRALNHAVDVQAVLSQLMGGRGRVATGVIPPILEGADTGRRAFAYDPAAARRLLAEAGLARGFDVDLWVSQTPPYPRVAEAIQSYLAAVGVRAKIQMRDSPSVREAARNGQTDLVLKTWYADYPDGENFLHPLLHGSAHGVGGNVSFYTNPAFDRLVTESRRVADDAARARLYRQADSIAYQDAPMIYLFFYNELLAVQPWIRGFRVPTIFNGQRWTDVEIGGR